MSLDEFLSSWRRLKQPNTPPFFILASRLPKPAAPRKARYRVIGHPDLAGEISRESARDRNEIEREGPEELKAE